MSKSIRCNGCGAEVVIPEGQKSAVCAYCGSTNTLKTDDSSPEGKADILIQRAHILLREGNFQRAFILAEQALNLNPKSAAAYIVHLMATLGVRQESDLIKNATPLTGYSSYNNAMQFGSAEQKDRLAEYNRIILKRMEEKAKEALKARQRIIKAFRLVGIVAAVIVVVALVIINYAIPQSKYNEAMDYAAQGDVSAAISLFSDITDFKDTQDQLNAIGARMDEEGNLPAAALAWREAGNTREMQKFKDLLSAGLNHIVGVQPDGTVLAAGKNPDGRCDVSEWTDIRAVSAGKDFTAGLKKDGTVVATGGNKWGQCDVSAWTDIVQIDAGNYYLLGLKSDGTVVAAGDNSCGRCDVSGWTDITGIAAGNYFSVGVRSDGTAVAVGDNEYGQCDVSGWQNIISVAAGINHTVGLQSDGSLVASGNDHYGQCDVSKATRMFMIDAAAAYTVAMKNNGYIAHAGDPPIDSYLYDPHMITISADYGHAYGLKEDGSVYMDDLLGFSEIGWNLFSVQSNKAAAVVPTNAAISGETFSYTGTELMDYLDASRSKNMLLFDKRHIYEEPDYNAVWANAGGVQIIAYTDPANQLARAIVLKLDPNYLGSKSEDAFLFYLEKILKFCNAEITQPDLFAELGISSDIASSAPAKLVSNLVGIDFTRQDDSISFKIYPDSTSLNVNALPVVLDPSADFLYDDERRDQVRILNIAYDYPSILDMANEYITQYNPKDADSVYTVRNLAQNALDALENCTVEKEEDEFMGSVSAFIHYNGINGISPDVNLFPYIDQKEFMVKAGFTSPEWINCQKVTIKVGENDYITARLNDTEHLKTANGVTEYGNLELIDDDIQKIVNAKNPVLRFTGENGESTDHFVTPEEQAALGNVYAIQAVQDSLFELVFNR